MNLKFIVIECPYSQWNNREMQHWFNQFIATKKAGFEREYPSGVIPLGTYDFIANILIVIDDSSQKPLCVFKSTSQKRCSQFHMKDELSNHIALFAEKKCMDALTNIIQNATTQGHEVGYISSWTIHPDAIHHPFKKLIREVSMALLYHYHQSFKITQALAGGAVRFKVPEFLAEMGFSEIKDSTHNPLNPVASPFLFGEQSRLMHLTQFSELAQQNAKKYQKEWDNRLEFRLPFVEELNKAA